jgi:hypothetical protein
LYERLEAATGRGRGYYTLVVGVYTFVREGARAYRPSRPARPRIGQASFRITWPQEGGSCERFALNVASKRPLPGLVPGIRVLIPP